MVFLTWFIWVVGGTNSVLFVIFNINFFSSFESLFSCQLFITNAFCFQHFCGGTMIAPNMVLTAAHCFTDLVVASREEPIQPIYVANYPRCRHLNDPSRERLPVDRVFIHPEYNSVTFNGDVAIVTLLKKFEGPTVEIDFDLTEVKIGSELQVVGYGYTGDEDRRAQV
eukprot:TRINITY_DN1562_c0_g2_i1.p3 TRINITY_DN1562_c0_g2~~TRINITY_DN1562_c0_g2_i1.p3  ORF type:complete len:168 (-),score=14.10 TRINITY_DN1562_c0_g2_i1:22-525(-)